MRLEKYLVLNGYLLSELGYKDFEELRGKLRDQQEGFDQDGRSYFVGVIVGQSGLRIPGSLLLRYDSAIRQYVYRLRRNRKQPNFNFKYFQYLALLFTEIFLHRLFSDERRLLQELNKFVKEFNQTNNTDVDLYSSDDLRKLAFWIATGGGKTLIMHVNYWQFLRHSREKYDNILLITPNSELSKQHFGEMRRSGLPCKLYDGNPDNLGTEPGQVLIVDIYKLTEEKTGSGVSVDISSFDGKNLVFIDEGHKGQRSEEQTWKKLREEIGKTGFILEYSATFGQVIGRDADLLEEYSKSILFNYSYKYFYSDDYGKDFYVYNLREDLYTDKHTETILTANLLAYYEQLVLFDENEREARSDGYERPLWVFVGSKVSGNRLESDVIRVIKFFKKTLENPSFLAKTADSILKGKSGLVDSNDQDVFRDRFVEVRKRFGIRDLYRKVFGSQGNLEIFEIKNAEGELGLKVGEFYFGVVNIGDVDAVKKLLKEAEIDVKDDSLTQSLFSDINERSSKTNILVGARKFIEGWDSWRVSSMGLVNMGKGEGPQIIQIFGRGVRLKGRNFSLKRLSSTDYLTRSLQTLYIFGLNADYINAFLESVRAEEVEYEEISVPIRLNKPKEWVDRLHTIKTRDDFDFADFLLDLEVDEELMSGLTIDLRPKIVVAHGLETSVAETTSSELRLSSQAQINMIDWDSVYLGLVDYKLAQGYFNLLIRKDEVLRIIESGKYKILVSPEQRELESFSEVPRIENMIRSYLEAYVDRFYHRAEKREAMSNLTLVRMNREDDNVNFKEYSVRYPKNSGVVNEVHGLIKDLARLYGKDDATLPSINFDRHLYTPLMVYSKGREEIKSSPIKLNKGETKFIAELRNFVVGNPTKLKGSEIFVLRNLSKRGIGFFQSSGFYPDFIMWVKRAGEEKIVFLDPKGIRNLGTFEDEKIEFCNSTILEIGRALKAKTKLKVSLDSFILSVTRPEDVMWAAGASRADFEQHKIVFLTDSDWVERLMTKFIK